ncbi:ndufs4 NADH dehydrogenase Fe-S protein subunit [Metarhizium acridum]|uniref:ndufs4 NADH dehydrogenase Fe-S protein subunit n=1 Tax=Metarhizium acridum TaxID=92637 RepID=UPI001C6C6239|nr:ndufs4 NADH dehydrogenase Fe-S protein subunit [Metarhizium acridum]
MTSPRTKPLPLLLLYRPAFKMAARISFQPPCCQVPLWSCRLELFEFTKEAKPATQSGDFRTERWRMDWDILPKGHRWENPLMGWQSSGDFMQGTHVNFKSKEDAIHFAEKQGYEYFVQEPNSRKFTPKAYANNFLYSPKKLKHIRTK